VRGWRALDGFVGYLFELTNVATGRRMEDGWDEDAPKDERAR